MNKILLREGEPLRFSQVAVLAPTPEKVQRMKDAYHKQGTMSEWIRDIVTADNIDGVLKGTSFEAELNFNYDAVPDMEFEILRPLSGHSAQWFPRTADVFAKQGASGMSHMGVHVEDIVAYIASHPLLATSVLLQLTRTSHHSGTSRRYLYALVDTVQSLGFITKLIQRVE